MNEVSSGERFRNYLKQIKKQYWIAKSNLLESYNRISNRFKVEDNIVICGTGRGGTTWLAELFLSVPKTAILWEPLHPVVLRNTKYADLSLQLGNMPYIPENEVWDEAYDFFNDLMQGKILFREFIIRNNKKFLKDESADLFTMDKWIIKNCRSNMLLPWLVRNFELRPPVFLIRHPCAVVSSQLRHISYDSFVPGFEKPGGRYTDIYYQYEKIIREAKTREEALAIAWCLENIIPLNHPANNKGWITVAYEDLIVDPESHLKNIFSRLSLPMPDGILEKVDKPSFTTKEGSPILEGKNQLTGWQKHLSKDQVNLILGIVEKFGIEIYDHNPSPSLKLYNMSQTSN